MLLAEACIGDPGESHWLGAGLYKKELAIFENPYSIIFGTIVAASDMAIFLISFTAFLLSMAATLIRC